MIKNHGSNARTVGAALLMADPNSQIVEAFVYGADWCRANEAIQPSSEGVVTGVIDSGSRIFTESPSFEVGDKVRIIKL